MVCIYQCCFSHWPSERYDNSFTFLLFAKLLVKVSKIQQMTCLVCLINHVIRATCQIRRLTMPCQQPNCTYIVHQLNCMDHEYYFSVVTCVQENIFPIMLVKLLCTCGNRLKEIAVTDMATNLRSGDLLANNTSPWSK
jgi:hypothetical protein